MFRLLGIIVAMTYAIRTLDVVGGPTTIGEKIDVTLKEKNLNLEYIFRRGNDFVIQLQDLEI